MVQNQTAKVIQSRLSRKGASFSLAQIKRYLADTYPETSEFDETELSNIVAGLLPKSNEIVPASIGDEIVDVDIEAEAQSALSHHQKQELIQQVATKLEVSLSVEQVKQISQKMDWAMSDRTSLKDRIQSAIIAWIDYQIDQDKLQTDQMMLAVEGHLSTRLQESNQHFADKSTAFSNRVNQAVEGFRSTEAEILDLFKIPS